jgi:hypothetical protein
MEDVLESRRSDHDEEVEHVEAEVDEDFESAYNAAVERNNPKKHEDQDW